ncbi:GDSL-type esterase/lipase family protein [Paenibacillus sp. KQZ6P-2]|uniref:GDSL-type esterase/lipase family protein n=1 Tax=Paenibacillus mangrovi TaxID=2931978 RepID=A0A9X1WPS9_9BACL|nr:stalk domain-containing protein [Paenibacillus mangrovi]MCJ8011740.1 GDSL-type esterase/lipase family protein [Paenibacillus mangrovi]
MQTSFKKYISTVSAAVLLSSMLLGAASAAPDAQPADAKQPYRIVALGDSLTVGYEPGKSEKDRPYGFVDRLQEQALLHGRAETVNVGIAGLKSGGLQNFVEAVKKGQAITADEIQPKLPDLRTPQIGVAAPQTKSDLAAADAITITIGGNDMSELLDTAGKLSEAELQTRVEQLFKQYTDSMGVIVADLHELNPDALIVVADQYQPMPEIADRALYPKLEKVAESFTGVIDKMAAGFESQGIHVKVAHVAKEFVGGEGTMTHMIKDRDFHPNQLGYEAMAKEFSEAIWGSYNKLATHEVGTPMGIIVKGKELNTPYKPVIRQNLNFVAIKDIVDSIGATSKWDNKTSSATITYEGHTVVITIGSKTVKVDGKAVPIEAAAFLNKVGNESKTYVPLAALASGLGLDVQYISNLRTVFINP